LESGEGNLLFAKSKIKKKKMNTTPIAERPAADLSVKNMSEEKNCMILEYVKRDLELYCDSRIVLA
jgi:hypothetical protein